jgi:hypothetical protein
LDIEYLILVVNNEDSVIFEQLPPS